MNEHPQDGAPHDGAGRSQPHGPDCVPPSAAGHLEPYGVRVLLRPTSHALEPKTFLVRLLEDLAASCEASGASVIGHLKCLLHTPGGNVACNLTSTRSGAACSARGEGAAAALPPGAQARLDLAVLVYGLPASIIASLVQETLAAALGPLGVSWSITS